MITHPRTTSPRRNRAVRGLLLAMAGLPALLTATSSVQAQSLSWSSAGSSTLGGTGNWDLTSSLWWDGDSAESWPSSGTANSAVFAGTAGTVTLTEAVAANSLRFNTTGYTLSGAQTLTLNGTAPSIFVGTGATATIGNNTALVLAGSAGLTKTGAGTITLNGSAANTFTGGVNVNGGTLALNFANFGVSTPFNNLVANTNGLSLSSGALTIAGKAVASSTTTQTFANTTVNSGISRITLTNGSGATSVTTNLGQVTLNTGSTLMLGTNPAAATAYTVANGGSITLPGSGSVFARAGIMYGTGSGTRWAQVSSAGVLGTSPSSTPFTAADPGAGSAQLLANINNANTPIAGAFQSYGTLLNPSFSTATVTIGNGGSWTFNGIIGINTFNAAISSTGTGRIIIGSERDFVVNLATSGSLNVNAPITNNGGGASNLTVSSSGTGITNLNGVNTYTGLTTINSGTTVIGTTGTINDSSGLVINGGTFRYNNTTTALTPAATLNGGTLTGVGAVTLGAVTVGNNAAAIITNNNGAAGAALTTGNLTFNGAASLNLFLNSTSAALVAGGISTNSDGIVTITPVFNTGLWSTGTTYNLVSYTGGSVGGAGFGQFALGTVAGLTSRQSTLLGNSGSALTMTVNGDNPLWLGGTNGDWNTTQAGNWRLVTAGTATNFISGDEVHFTDAATGTTNVNITENVATTAVLFNNTAQDYTIGSTGGFGVTSAASVTKNGTGTVTLSSNNTYAGGTAVNAGTLRLQGGNAIGNTSLVTLADVASATVEVQASETIGGLAGGGTTGGTVSIANGQTLTLAGAGTPSYAGSLTGLGGLSLTGSANQTFTGVANYAGGTDLGASSTMTINRSASTTLNGALTGTGVFSVAGSGSVALGAANDFGGRVNLANTSTSILDISANNQTFGALSGGGATASGLTSGTVAVGTRNLTLTAATNQVYSGMFTGSGDIIINAAAPASGTVTFGADNTGKSTAFTGNVRVQAGTFIMGKTSDILGTNSVGLGNQAIIVSNGATARLSYGNAAFVQNQNFVLNGTGSDGLGALQSLGANFGNPAIGGIVAATDSLVRVTRDNSDSGTRTLLVRNSLAGSGNLTFDGGTGTRRGIVQLNVSSAELTLGGTTYGAFSGNLNLTNNITMIANASNAFGNVKTVDVASGSTLTFNSVASQTIGGLQGAGTVNVNGATLTLGAGDATASFSGTIANVSSNGSLIKTGAGSQTLTGVNTYSGATTVNAGTLLMGTGGSIDNTSGISVASGATFTNNSATAITKALTIGEGATINGTGAVTAAGMTFNASIAGGLFTAAILGDEVNKGGQLTFSLTDVQAGSFTVFSGSSIGGSFSSVFIGSTQLTQNGNSFSGTVGLFNYVYDDAATADQLIISAIPEPSAFAVLAGLGALGFAASRRRRR